MPTETRKITPELLDLLGYAWIVISEDMVDDLSWGSDAIQTEHGYGGFVDEDEQVLQFTFFPVERVERWTIRMSLDELEEASTGAVPSLAVEVATTSGTSDAPRPQPKLVDEDEDDDDDDSGRYFLTESLAREWLELVDGADMAALLEATEDVVTGRGDAETRAAKLMELWLSHEAVDDVFASDDDLVGLIEHW